MRSDTCVNSRMISGYQARAEEQNAPCHLYLRFNLKLQLFSIHPYFTTERLSPMKLARERGKGGGATDGSTSALHTTATTMIICLSTEGFRVIFNTGKSRELHPQPSPLIKTRSCKGLGSANDVGKRRRVR